MKKIYVAGNPLVREDSIPVRLMDRLQKRFPGIEFHELEPTDNLPEEKDLNIIDTVIGIDDIKVIRDIDKIVTGKIYSMHDFDLGFNLKLMKKAGKLRSVKIIGVPPNMSEEKAFEDISKIVEEL